MLHIPWCNHSPRFPHPLQWDDRPPRLLKPLTFAFTNILIKQAAANTLWSNQNHIVLFVSYWLIVSCGLCRYRLVPSSNNEIDVPEEPTCWGHYTAASSSYPLQHLCRYAFILAETIHLQQVTIVSCWAQDACSLMPMPGLSQNAK